MNLRKAIFFVITSGSIIPSYAMKLESPTIVLTEWKNKTPHTIDFLKGNFGCKGTKLFDFLNAGQENGICESIPLSDPREQYAWNINERIGHIDISRSDDDKAPYLKLWVQHLPSDKKIILTLLHMITHEQRQEICSREISLHDSVFSIEIEGIVEGNQFEQSKINTCINSEISLLH